MLQDIRNTTCEYCEFGCTTASVCQIAESVEVQPGMLMVITDYPSKQDSANDTVMRGVKDKLFWDIAINVCHVPKEDIYPAYAVKCRSDRGDKPSETEYEACKEYLLQEIFLVKPKCILVLGTTAANLLGLYAQSLDLLRSHSHDVTFEYGKKKFKTKVNVTYAPYYVENAPNSLIHFAKDIVKAHNIAIDKVESGVSGKVKMIATIDEIKQVIRYVRQTKECCFDFETTDLTELGVHAEDFRATMLSISFQHGSSYTIPLWHHEHLDSDTFNHKVLSLMSKYVWADPSIRKIGQNLKYDMSVAARYGYPLFRGRLDDPMLMHHILYEYKKHGLKDYIVDYYPEYGGYEDAVKQYGYSKAPLDVLSPYAGSDTDLTFRACTIFETLLMQDKRSYKLYRSFTMFVFKPMFYAEQTGMPVDRGVLEKHIRRANNLLTEQENKLRSYPEFKR